MKVGGDRALTPEQQQVRQKIAEMMMARGAQARPSNVVDGLNSAADSIMGALMMRRSEEAKAKGQAQFDDEFGQVAPNTQGLADLADSPYAGSAHRSVIEALLKGAPNYRRGTRNHPGGMAVVGENGPEAVMLPPGARVRPSEATTPPNGIVPLYKSGDLDNQVIAPWNDPYAPHGLYSPPNDMYFYGPGEPPAPQMRQPMETQQNMGPKQDPDAVFDPSLMEGYGVDPRGMFWDESKLQDKPGGSFAPGAEYQTADLAGMSLDANGMTSSKNNKVIEMATTYRSFIDTLNEYERLINKYGGEVMPGPAKDQIKTTKTALMMQLKDIYGMGAPQQGDLAMLERLIFDATDLAPNALEFFGGPTVKDRSMSSLGQLRKAVSGMVEPYMKAGNVDMNDLLPKPQDLSKMSDEELLKMLGN